MIKQISNSTVKVFNLVTISSDFRSMSTHAQSVIDEMKAQTKDSNQSEAY